MKYFFTPGALRDIKKLSPTVQRRIISKLDFFVSGGNHLKYATPLIDSLLGHFRYRIGDYWVIFDIDNKALVILRVGHRKDIYR